MYFGVGCFLWFMIVGLCYVDGYVWFGFLVGRFRGVVCCLRLVFRCLGFRFWGALVWVFVCRLSVACAAVVILMLGLFVFAFDLAGFSSLRGLGGIVRCYVA